MLMCRGYDIQVVFMFVLMITSQWWWNPIAQEAYNAGLVLSSNKHDNERPFEHDCEDIVDSNITKDIINVSRVEDTFEWNCP